MNQDTILRDLLRHADSKVEMAVHDYIDLCDSVEINGDYARAHAIKMLFTHIVALAHTIETDEHELVNVCRVLFHAERQARRG